MVEGGPVPAQTENLVRAVVDVAVLWNWVRRCISIANRIGLSIAKCPELWHQGAVVVTVCTTAVPVVVASILAAGLSRDVSNIAIEIVAQVAVGVIIGSGGRVVAV